MGYGWLKDNPHWWGGGSGGGGAVPLPDTANIIFQHDLYDGDTTAQVGTYTYTRSGTVAYASGLSTVSKASTDALPIGYRFGGEGGRGAQLGSGFTNYALYSEDFTNGAWAAVGGGATAANSATDPMGTSTADTISGSSAGDGVSQYTAAAAASKIGVFSVWLKTSTGTATVDLKISDNTNTQSAVTKCAVTTDWKRWEVSRYFNASASGNLRGSILVGNTSTVRAWGAQIEQRTVGQHNWRSARDYTPTVGSAAALGADSYLIPNATITDAAVQGSIAFWLNPSWDASDGTSGAAVGLFGVTSSNEILSISIGSDILYVWLNGGQKMTSHFVAPTRNEWSHWVYTWNTTTDVYKVYVNGVEALSNAGASASVNFGAGDLRIGGYGSSAIYCSDSILSQVVLWKTALSAANVTELYATKSATFAPAEIGTGKLFEVALGTSPIPVVGSDKQYWYEAATPPSYYDSTTSVQVAADGDYLAPAYPLNGTAKAGLQFNGWTNNQMIQSESPANVAWTKAGTPTVTDGVAAFGDLALGTIDGDNTEGILQSSAIAAVSEKFNGSVFASTASGTATFKITIEGDSGATPESLTSSEFTATTTVQRFGLYKEFTAAATGNARMKVLLTGTAVLRVGGMQLEQAYFAGGLHQSQVKVPNKYIRTTTAAFETHGNSLIYPAANHRNNTKGTVLAWVALDADNNTDLDVSKGPTVIGSAGHYYDFYCTVAGPGGAGALFFWWTNTTYLSSAANLQNGRWARVAYSWDRTNSPGSLKAYLDGTKVLDTTTTNPASPKKSLWIGQDGLGGHPTAIKALDSWVGLIDQVEIWGAQLSDAEITSDYNATKATYGR